MTDASNFHFLRTEWPDIFEAASKVESLAHSDPRSACFYARRGLELAVRWLYKHDPALHLPYQDHLSALLHEPTFRETAGEAIFAKARVIKDLGNQAVHSHKVVRPFDAVTATRELFHVTFWLARTYARHAPPPDDIAFTPELLPTSSPIPKQTLDELKSLASQLRERDERLSELLAGKASLDEELQRLRDEVSAVKKANDARPDTHNYSEAETRDYYIDLLLKEAGWPLDQARDREFPVQGMPNTSGEGFVDYVLWGDDGKPLGIVEAKRTKRDARVGQQQAKLYADCLESAFGQRPVIFYSNGYEHWIWDDQMYPPRSVQGFYKKDELALMVQRRATRGRMADTEVNESIVERYYQMRAIRRVTASFEHDHIRKSLLVMATGAGKTRTVIALSELLMNCNWAKRILFLADRVALVNQAVGAYKKHLPTAPPVNLVKEKEQEGRVYVSTYPTMMGLIEESHHGERRFGVGHFDLVIIDEAHRSVYQKYRAIFDYFDSLLIGLTATPKEELDRNTYGFFELERGVPTDYYGLNEAVEDGYLVPPRAVSVPLKFQRDGISYDDLPDDEQEEWDALEWSDEGDIPDRVEAAAVNKWLFNIDTVDKALEQLMQRGEKVAGGDRLGKTIIFAKNHQHAEFIAERFNANYPHYKGEFARVIDFTVEYVQNLIDDFSTPEKSPHIAISVDMLDTGIDIPDVVNLVFFKLVRSKTKFWQMLGRGTRLRPDLYGPGRDKEFFYIFDYCQNLEFFKENFGASDGTVAESLGKRLFKKRLELIATIDQRGGEEEEITPREVHTTSPDSNYPKSERGLRNDIAESLREEVGAMNPNNFIVRPKRQSVEKYSKSEAWETLDSEAIDELSRQVAGLPSETDPENEEAKRFDLLMLNLQLGLLRHQKSFTRLRDHAKGIAELLEEKSAIPMVQSELPLIQELQTDEWWQDVTAPMLENVRKRLRSLVKLIDKSQRKQLYTHFTDDLGDAVDIELPGFVSPDSYARFVAKARAFLKAHENHIAITKLRMNEPLTPTDLAELERMLAESGIGTPEDVRRASEQSQGLGLFVRSLVGMNREAAKSAFTTFLSGKTLTANQIEFVDLMINHLTEHGTMTIKVLYESPYTDFSPLGVEGVFASAQVFELMGVLQEVRGRAAA